jgi:hypothetical protein
MQSDQQVVVDLLATAVREAEQTHDDLMIVMNAIMAELVAIRGTVSAEALTPLYEAQAAVERIRWRQTGLIHAVDRQLHPERHARKAAV